MEQMKRGLCLYDDKWYLFTELPDCCPNLHLHAYGKCDLAAKDHRLVDQAMPGAKLMIRHRREQFIGNHAQVTRRLEQACVLDIKVARNKEYLNKVTFVP